MAVELAALDRVDGNEQDLDLGGREEEGGRIQGESGGGERWPGWLWRRAGCGASTCRVGVLTVRVCAATAEQACEAELTLLSRADERAALSSTRSTARPPGSCRERATASTSTDGPGAPARRRPRAVLLPPLLLLLSLSLSLLPRPTAGGAQLGTHRQRSFELHASLQLRLSLRLPHDALVERDLVRVDAVPEVDLVHDPPAAPLGELGDRVPHALVVPHG